MTDKKKAGPKPKVSIDKFDLLLDILIDEEKAKHGEGAKSRTLDRLNKLKDK